MYVYVVCMLASFLTASQPSLSLLPDNIALKIISYLDIPSMISLAKVNHRYYHLHLDEFIWTDVDLSTIPRLDVRKLKQLIREKLHHALWRITLRSNAVECQRHSSMRPIVTSSAVDELFQKCCTIRNIKLENVDLSQVIHMITCYFAEILCGHSTVYSLYL